jgi:hypothetical protein
MCKRKSYQIDRPAMTAKGAYEGQTVRLDRYGIALGLRETGRPGRFPGWSLWLIWPLIGLLKWVAPVYLGALAALRDAMSTQAQPVAMVTAILLIVGGLALIRRD